MLVVTIAAFMAFDRPASCQDAREVRAKTACAAGRVDEGVELLAALFAETGDVNYVYNQGRCYQQNGVTDKAINRFKEYLRRATSLAAADRQEVELFITELEKTERRQAAEAAEASAAREHTAGDSSRLRKIGLGLSAVGALAVATGVVLSFKVRNWEHEVEQRVDQREMVDNQELSGWMRDGGRLETFQWVAYGVGAAALAGGATCFLVGHRAQREQVALTVVPASRGQGMSATLQVRY